jgi:competence protein ComEC
MRGLFLLLGFCAGIAAYFWWPSEPAINCPIIIAILCAANFFAFRKIGAAAAFAVLFGFFYSMAYSQNFGAAPISRPMRNVEISGVVKNLDYTPDKTRVFLDDYRLSLPADIPAPSIGDSITATATMFPPGAADVPGGYDFAEWAYFHGVSATGYITEIAKTEGRKPKADIASLRNELHKKLNSPLFDSLVLGYKHTLTDTENNAWKAAGVSHVFSISGFHITLVGGWLFAIFYLIFRSIPSITRRMPARFPATACAAVGLLF